MATYGRAGAGQVAETRFAQAPETPPKQTAYHSPSPRLASVTALREFVTKLPIESSTRLDKRCRVLEDTVAPFLRGERTD